MSETSNNDVEEQKKDEVKSDAENPEVSKTEEKKEEVKENEDKEEKEEPKKVEKKSTKKPIKEKQPPKETKKQAAKKNSSKKEPAATDNGEENDDEDEDEKKVNDKKVTDNDVEEDEEDEEEEEEEESEDERGEKKLPWLDQPLEVSGARERKKVERLDLSFNVPTKEKKTDIPDGDGDRLGDSPRIEFQINKFRSDDLKVLHRVLYSRPGTTAEIKKNIRRFSGFSFKKDSTEFERKRVLLDKSTTKALKSILEVLDLERSGTKEELVSRIMDFLMKPKLAEERVPASKRTRGSSKNNKGKGASKKADKKGSKKGKVSGSEEDEEEEGEEEDGDIDEVKDEEIEDDVVAKGSVNDLDESMDDEDQSESEKDDDSDGDYGARKPKVKRKPVKRKQTPAKKVVKNKTPAKKEEPKEEKKPVLKPQQKRKKVIESEGDESSDDEPLLKKGKNPPTDDDLTYLIKNILNGANLEEITMKTVCKQVYAAFPDFDLSDRKDFIKSTVRSIIS